MRKDDYARALEMALAELRNRNPLHICKSSHAEPIENQGRISGIRLAFLGRMIIIRWPSFELFQDSNEELSIKQKILLLHYLNGAKAGGNIKHEWISYQDIPSARFYLDAFNRRTKYPLVDAFGDCPERLLEAGEGLFGAVQSSFGDVSVLVQALPKVPVVFVIWRGDEEFSPEVTILFDRSIADMLSAEDIAELTGMIVYPLISWQK